MNLWLCPAVAKSDGMFAWQKGAAGCVWEWKLHDTAWGYSEEVMCLQSVGSSLHGVHFNPMWQCHCCDISNGSSFCAQRVV